MGLVLSLFGLPPQLQSLVGRSNNNKVRAFFFISATGERREQLLGSTENNIAFDGLRLETKSAERGLRSSICFRRVLS